MNKTEKIICVLLGGILVWYMFTQKNAPKPQQQPVAPETVATSAAVQNPAQNNAAVQNPAQYSAPLQQTPQTPEETVVLENDELRLELSSWGGVVKKATLKKYAQNEGDVGEDNPSVEFDFSASKLGAVRTAGAAAIVPYEIAEATPECVTFSSPAGSRKVTLGANYLVTYEDAKGIFGAGDAKATISVGSMTMGSSKNDLLSVDSWTEDAKGGKVVHHDEGDSPLKGYLVGGAAGGCSGSKSAAGLPKTASVWYPGQEKWVALKNRFFVTALVSSSVPVSGFNASIERDMTAATYRPREVSASVALDPAAADGGTIVSRFYVGPKKQSLLWDLGMVDVMEFGMWRWICYPILWVLNLFNSFIPNYGVAIILLTILVRLLFWPLTHKSTVGMKKMQEIQPLMKELQAKYKDNPQRLQQETFALYRTHKVNPMSSCLPMLIQIPVFIALFNVLRSAVELRYAPFLWIGDLSQPEGLFASWFPFGGLNILPILMALTMGLQSALTPSTGDKNQQKMMTIFMPVMMLVMFYSFPSALSLYWTLSQAVSIVQMWLIRRSAAKAAAMPEVIDPVTTRQMRRHG